MANSVDPVITFSVLFVKIYSYQFVGLTLLHSARPKLYGVLAVLSAIGLMVICSVFFFFFFFFGGVTRLKQSGLELDATSCLYNAIPTSVEAEGEGLDPVKLV